MAVINDEAGTLIVTDQSGAGLLDETAAQVLPRSIFPMTVTVELLINSAWVDISSFVYYRDGITITGGKTAEADTAQPATAQLTLDNRDGRFTPNYTAGAYYPWLQRNVQLRISVAATSTTGNHYSGYRFWGEVHRWPPRSDPSATDIYVPITAHGPLRRIRRHGGQGSALQRYYATLTGSFAPIAYWPCEEDPDTTIVGAGLAGGTNMTVTVGTPKWRAVSDFNGSAPIGVLNRSTWDGLTGSPASSGLDIFATAGTYQWVAPVTSATLKMWASSGGGENGFADLNVNSGAGGGGGFRTATLTLIVGNTYQVTVPPGGLGGVGSGSQRNAGGDGADASFTDEVATFTATKGKGGGTVTPGVGGLGGTGSFSGGKGGDATFSNGVGGGGGGSSAGTGANGNAGANSVNPGGGAGGAAPAGGAAGGHGGATAAGSASDPGDPGQAPGGGGGGGGHNNASGWGKAGGAGAPGRYELSYTPPSSASTNVVRFILFVPRHGGNPNKALININTGGTIASMRVYYVAGGGLQLKGFSLANAAGSVLFNSGAQSWNVDGQTVMVSVELSNSGANVAWAFKAIKPGASAVIGTASGTVTTASVGNVSEVVAGPNADITKTAIGHISVQYALIDLRRVSHVLHGHHTEMTVDRFLRLAKEEALDNVVAFNEESDHWGFETGLQGWTATNAVPRSATSTFVPLVNLHTYRDSWPTDGTHSLQLTATGEGQVSAASPTGLSGQPVTVGDIVSVAADNHVPGLHNNQFVGIQWWTAAGAAAAHPEDDSEDTAVPAGGMTTIKASAKAPTGAAFFSVIVGSHSSDTAGVNQYWDHVRVGTRMGAQTRKRLHHFLEEIEALESVIIGDTIGFHGARYRTRIAMHNQLPALTLDWPSGHFWKELSPTVDDKPVRNDITVHRHKGSKVRVQLDSGQMSVQEPPAGHGRHKHHHRVDAEIDEQLARLANHILNLGTDMSERYPVVSLNLARTEVASLMSAIAGIEISDFIKITGLPFWYPSATAKQLVIGYTERLSQFQWEIDWNCTSESPWEVSVSSIRRW